MSSIPRKPRVKNGDEFAQFIHFVVIYGAIWKQDVNKYGKTLFKLLKSNEARGRFRRLKEHDLEKRKITARINKHCSPCAVVSGIFLDPVPVWPDAPEQITGNPGELRKLHTRYKEDRSAFYRKVMPRLDVFEKKFSERNSPVKVWHRAWFNAAVLRPRKAVEVMQAARKHTEEADNQLASAFASALQGVDEVFAANKWTFGRGVLQNGLHSLRLSNMEKEATNKEVIPGPKQATAVHCVMEKTNKGEVLHDNQILYEEKTLRVLVPDGCRYADPF